jgi:hypothetical protein
MRHMSSIGMVAGESRLTNMPCKVEDYAAVFEIAVSDLRPELGRTVLSVDLAEPSGQPIIDPGARVLRQAIFQDAVPWIMVTLFDTSPIEP